MKAGHKPEKSQSREQNTARIRFSIGAKLVTIITILVLLSLGTITVLVSVLVSEDIKISSEERNFEVNRRSASETETTLEYTRSNAFAIIQIINAAGGDSNAAAQAARFYFEQNRYVAALSFGGPGRPDRFITNEFFVYSQEIEIAHDDSFREISSANMEKAAAGETLIFNVTPHFGVFLLEMVFPMPGGASGGILFSPEGLGDTLGFGMNKSYLINGEGELLVHGDFDLLMAGTNLSKLDYIRDIRENPARNMQYLTSDAVEYDGQAPAVVLSDYGEAVQKSLQYLRRSLARIMPSVPTEKENRYFVAFTKLDIASAIVITTIEYDKVFEGIAATTRRNAYLTAAVLFFSILFIWFFSKSISIPLKVLAGAARSIEEGSFEVDIRPKGSDEISILGASFKRMSKALGIFGRFTNREIALRAMRGEIKPGGQPKHATVFFSDIRNFTAKSEQFTVYFGKEGSDRIVHWLNGYLTSMVECIEKTGGVVDKFIGDAVMAHWGTAYSAGSARQDAFNGIKASLMMRAALLRMNSEREAGDRGNPRIQIGCGLNTGIVTAGQIGSDLRMEYTVIGDPVNLASRTESLCKSLGTDILITENTWSLVKDQIIAEEMPPVKVRGKEEPIRIFAVINLASVSSGPRSLAELRKLLGYKLPARQNRKAEPGKTDAQRQRE